MSSKELAVLAARAASDKKATDIVALDVAELLVVTDYFVICTANSAIQVRAIADEVEDRLRIDGGVKPIGREGAEEAKWVLLDFADLVIHVFQPAEREFYRLEKLWGDAPRLEMPEDVTGVMAAGPVAEGEGPHDEIEALEDPAFQPQDD